MRGGDYSFVSQFVVLNLAEGIVDRLGGSQDYDDVEDAALYSRLAHERTHFVQNVATTYGLWKSTLMRSAGCAAFIALGRPDAPSVSNNEQPEGLVCRDVEASSTEPISFQSAGRIALTLFQTVKLIDDPVAPVGRWVFHSQPPQRSTHVHLKTPTIRMHLTAKNLIEFHARSAELDCLYNTREIDPLVRNTILNEVWGDAASQAPLRVCDNILNRRDRVSAHVCVAIAELALNGEWPFGSEESEPLMMWEDVDPGWRFVKACDCVAQNGLTLPESPRDIEQFKETVSQRMKWSSEAQARRRFWDGTGDQLHFEDLMTMSAAANELRSRCDLLTLWYREARTREFISRYCRGPSWYRHVGHHDLWKCTVDAALQRFLTGSYTCPSCLGSTHRNGCPVDALMRSEPAS